MSDTEGKEKKKEKKKKKKKKKKGERGKGKGEGYRCAEHKERNGGNISKDRVQEGKALRSVVVLVVVVLLLREKRASRHQDGLRIDQK